MKKLHHFTKTPQGKFVATVAGLVVVLFAYYFYALSKGQVTTQEEVTIRETDHVFGNPAAKVTLVEFGDFQCPACGAYEPIVEQVLKDNQNDVKFVFRHFPLMQIHQNALLAAKATEAAGLQGKFWEMHHMLYAKQKEWSEGLNARDYILQYARSLKLDIPRFTNDLSSKAVEEKILAEYKEGARLDVQGTPTFFLNGKKLENPRSLEEFQAVIKEAIGK
jgi:protein-disulfide isomerase